MKCPNCRKTATIDHLRESPECDKAVKSLCALSSRAKRPNDGKGGRPKGSKNK